MEYRINGVLECWRSFGLRPPLLFLLFSPLAAKKINYILRFLEFSLVRKLYFISLILSESNYVILLKKNRLIIYSLRLAE